MIRVRPLAMLVLWLGALALLSWKTLAALHRERDPASSKLEAADRVIVYRVLADRGPTFRLDGGRMTLKLITSAVVDSYDPSRITEYGLRLTLRRGRVLQTSELFLSSHESKARWDGKQWLDEAIWSSDGVGFTDERLVLLELPEVPRDTFLDIRLVGTPTEATARVFQLEPRDASERARAARQLDARARTELVRSSTYTPWRLLSEAEQDARLRHRWSRLAAEGKTTTDFTARTVYVTDFRIPQLQPTADGRLEIVAGYDAAINVRGPARLHVEPADASIELAADTGAEPLAVRNGVIEVGASVTTVVARTAATTPVRFTLTGPPGTLITGSEPPRVVGALVPDRVLIPVAAIGPESSQSPVEVSVVATPNPLLGRVIRVDARVIAPAWTSEPELATVTVIYRDRSGQSLGEDHVRVGGALSRFERLISGDDRKVVSEPTTFRVIAPPTATRVELRAEREVVVRLYRWQLGSERLADPYRSIEVTGKRWRYARRDERSWYPMSPHNARELAVTGQLVRLDAQVRLEPLDDGVEVAGRRDYQPIVPVGNPEQQRALEPVAPDGLADVLTSWPSGSRTRMASGSARELMFRADLAGNPRVAWVVDAGSVGDTLDVTIDDTTAVRVPITSARGEADLPPVTPGRHRVTITSPQARGLWIDRPPVAGAGVVRARTLYALRDEVAVSVVQKPGEVFGVYAIVYAKSRGAIANTTLSMVVDRGAPRRLPGVPDRLSIPEVKTTVPSATRDRDAELVDLGSSAGFPRTIRVMLQADLAPGHHEIRLAKRGPETLWVRFVTVRRDSGPREPTRWTRQPGAWERLDGDD